MKIQLSHDHPYLMGTYESLFQFVKKNTAIATRIDSIRGDTVKLSTLKQAIDTGDFENKIFSDPDCYLFLLLLMQQKQISFWQGITIYRFLMALAEFTKHQPMSLKPSNIKHNKVLMLPLTNSNNELTNLGHEFISDIEKKLAILFNITLDKRQLEIFILTLPKSEQYVSHIYYNELVAHSEFYQNPDNGFSIIAGQLVHEIGDLAVTFSKSSSFLCSPSFSLINFIIGLISDEPVNMLPIFGRISTETLLKLHHNNLHPIALYSPDVKNNYSQIHKTISSRIAILDHDIAHTLWGNALAAKDRNLIFQIIIPDLNELKVHSNCRSEHLKTQLESSISILNDFELLGYLYKKINKRFKNYLKNVYEKSLKLDLYNSPNDAISFYCTFIKKCIERNQHYDLKNLIPIKESFFETYPEIKKIIEEARGDEKKVKEILVANGYEKILYSEPNNLLRKALEIKNNSSKYDQITLDDARRLIEQGADINFTDKKGNTIIHSLAIQKDWHKIIQVIQLGASINDKDVNNISLFDKAWQKFLTGDPYTIPLIFFLIENGAEYTNAVEVYKSLLHSYATAPSNHPYTSFFTIKNLLLKPEVKPYITELLEVTLQFASKSREDFVRQILANYPDIARSLNINSIILNLASKNNFAYASIFLENDLININQTNENGDTLLHFAVMYEHIGPNSNGKRNVINLLLQKGADINIKNIDGNIPEDFITENKESIISSFLHSRNYNRTTPSIDGITYFQTKKSENNLLESSNLSLNLTLSKGM